MAQQSLSRLAKACRQDGVSLQVVLLPDFHGFRPYPFENEHRLIGEFLKSIQVPFLDLAGSFQDVTDARALWVALDDAHPNEVAHAMIARSTEDFIKSAWKGAEP